MDFDTIAARALNASLTTHRPSYAGLRILLLSLVKDQGALKQFLTRRCRSRQEWRYFGFQILKDGSTADKRTYRNCIIGSPITLLAEAYVLGLMAQQPAFAVPSCAYSYLWPQEARSGRNFQYFFEGYDRRNHAVALLLRENPDFVAVVTDIKSFYPTVSKERLRGKILARAEPIADPMARDTIEQFCLSLIDLKSPKTEGIPIGPDLSHVLGHVALESVDTELQKAFEECYLRYVDDNIIVCAKSKVERALAILKNALGREGLSLNDDKQDVVDAKTWHAENWSLQQREDSPSFGSLLDEITLYLIRRPRQADALHQRFREAGFSLPIRRLRSMAMSKRFRAHVRLKVSGGGFFAWFASFFTTQRSLLEQAEALREALLVKAKKLAEERPPSGPMRRRWYVQKRRYILNPLLYLLPPTEYHRLLALTPNFEEFDQNRLVIEALMSKDCTMALGAPGRVVTTLCQLWPEHLEGTTPKIEWPASPDRAAGEAAAHFALSLSVVPPATFLQALDEHTPGARLLVEMCGRGASDRGKIEGHSYLDEMDLLYESMPHETVELTRSRFDELEEIGLDGLLLGGPSYFVPGDFLLFSA